MNEHKGKSGCLGGFIWDFKLWEAATHIGA